ncbi:fatty acid synthase-like protein [Dinothrombium tinctorium]|uniref:Fatty acid synthase-like protein n=1 Tax=Dinothrombium tinctorium TaxID=1965070 RepID=A0A3S3RUQ2_9ACAR|nr:fatty acid synthase-like protein [Dinothrombium tinctorium]RWS04989.1 fatty acid synthase-like protein [Dinothrombium tinctorium]
MPELIQKENTKEVIWEMNEDIVVSGISGRFPESDNIDELSKNLFENVDMITEDDRRWPIGLYGLPTRSEVEEGLAQDVSKVSGYALTGCSRSMFANRISYTFDFQGPSYAMDTACSSSFLAFQQAILGMRAGQCERAIVGGNEKKVTREFLALLNEVSKIPSSSGMNYRGHMLIKNKTEENESYPREEWEVNGQLWLKL